MTDLLFIFLTALVLALIITPIAIKIAPLIGAVDIPKDNRRMHTKPMPRFGGVAIYIGTVTAMLAFMPIDSRIIGIIASGTLIFILGIVDDLRGLSAKVKLFCQIICAVILYVFSLRISGMGNPFNDGYIEFHWLVSLLITVIWIVGITNTVNLIDGLDGLAGGIAVIASICIAYTAFIAGHYEIILPLLALAGGALGFLPYNFNPAKIFMGDGGSLFLGFMLAALSVMTPVKGATVLAMIVPMLVLALPIFDTAFAILRRLINRRPIMEADKGHLHHRIMAVGLGQKKTVLTLYCISGVMGVSAIVMSRSLYIEAGILMLIAATLTYVFITDTTSHLHLKGINVADKERKKIKPAEEEKLKGEAKI